MIALVEAAIAKVGVLAETPTLWIVFDVHGTITAANDHARTLLGRDLVGLVLDDLVIEFDRGRAPSAYVAANGGPRRLNFIAFTGLPETYRCHFAKVNGHVVLLGLAPIREQEELRRELVLMNQELAEKRRELHRANIGFDRLGRLKSLFIGMAAHDLRSPLSVVKTYTEFLAEDLGPAASPDHQLLDGLRVSAELMRNLVNSFLDVALIESGRFAIEKKVHLLSTVARRALVVVEPTARRKDVRVVIDAFREPPLVLCDGAKIQQALVNLMNNAVQHSYPKSEVAVTLTTVGTEAVIAVRDRGTGMAPEVRHNLFVAFTHGTSERTAHERSVGLGLVITRMVAEAHNGRLTVDSEPGKGTTIALHLPMLT